MRFTAEKIEAISNRLDSKKRANPISGRVIGMGVKIQDSINKDSAVACIDDYVVCDVDNLSRFIVELTMLKDSIEEETGVIL